MLLSFFYVLLGVLLLFLLRLGIFLDPWGEGCESKEARGGVWCCILAFWWESSEDDFGKDVCRLQFANKVNIFVLECERGKWYWQEEGYQVIDQGAESGLSLFIRNKN